MMTRLLIALSLALGLAACGEPSQTATHRKADGHAYDGSITNVFTVPGWKPGDAASWAEQLKTRSQHQNESVRINAR